MPRRRAPRTHAAVVAAASALELGLESGVLPGPDGRAKGPRLTRRQRIVAAAVLAGQTPHQAAQLAGYSSPADPLRHGSRLRQALAARLDAGGVTDAVLVERLRQGLDATETKHYPWIEKVQRREPETGKVVETRTRQRIAARTLVNYTERRAALELALRLRDYLPRDRALGELDAGAAGLEVDLRIVFHDGRPAPRLVGPGASRPELDDDDPEPAGRPDPAPALELDPQAGELGPLELVPATLAPPRSAPEADPDPDPAPFPTPRGPRARSSAAAPSSAAPSARRLDASTPAAGALAGPRPLDAPERVANPDARPL